LLTTAVNSSVAFSGMRAFLGATDAAMADRSMVATPEDVGSVTEVATRLTVRSSGGGVDGAV
jgi:hypothetical protein